MSLLLTIQSIHQELAGSVTFWNERVRIPFPAEPIMIGGQGDLTISLYVSLANHRVVDAERCSPWTETNLKYDFLQPTPPCLSDITLPCPIWPSCPPRGDMSCEISSLCHPLVSPVASEVWARLPPLFFAYGDEYIGHEGKYMAQQASEQGVAVELHHCQHLSHIFPIMYPNLPQSQHALEQMARFCRTCVQDPTALKTQHLRYHPTDMSLRGIDCGLPFSTAEPDVVRSRMIDKQTQRKIWTGSGRREREPHY